MHDPLRVFEFLAERQKSGQPAALVTIMAVEGASIRNPGAHMAVAADGRYVGSLSGGCIEAAVVNEALRAISSGAPHVIRFGQGSPIIDIRLPCGGSVDLLFSPVGGEFDPGTIARRLRDRQSVNLSLPHPAGHVFAVDHSPPLRIAILGHGASVEALASLAGTVGCEVAIFTPDDDLADRAGPGVTRLRSVAAPPPLDGDKWTAFAVLFHDHHWEAPLLASALAGDSLYVGAMGSRITHHARIAELSRLGVPDDAIARIKAPIGIIPSSRDPETLALSILTEIVAAYNATQPTRVHLEGQ
jgi:xanthine dehydrogenase accessory factor